MHNPVVVQIPVDQLIPYARNARTHSAAQVAQIAASIKIVKRWEDATGGKAVRP
jgi:hypothetical protein